MNIKNLSFIFLLSISFTHTTRTSDDTMQCDETDVAVLQQHQFILQSFMAKGFSEESTQVAHLLNPNYEKSISTFIQQCNNNTTLNAALTEPFRDTYARCQESQIFDYHKRTQALASFRAHVLYKRTLVYLLYRGVCHGIPTCAIENTPARLEEILKTDAEKARIAQDINAIEKLFLIRRMYKMKALTQHEFDVITKPRMAEWLKHADVLAHDEDPIWTTVPDLLPRTSRHLLPLYTETMLNTFSKLVEKNKTSINECAARHKKQHRTLLDNQRKEYQKSVDHYFYNSGSSDYGEHAATTHSAQKNAWCTLL